MEPRTPILFTWEIFASDMHRFLCPQGAQNPKLRLIPVMSLAISVTADDAIKAYELGVVAYFPMPATFSEL